MTKATQTAVKMLETLPSGLQVFIVEKLRELVEEARDDARWDELFEKHRKGLATAAGKARKQIAEGKAMEMDFNKL
jgi:hypothetical protein